MLDYSSSTCLFSAQVGTHENCANYELFKPVPNRFFRPIFFSVFRRECESMQVELSSGSRI